MKTTTLLLTLCAVLALPVALSAQSASCSDFTITAVQPDTQIAGQYQISIQMAGAASNFINYPFVAAVLDCNGDTVATGNIFYFGQLGQSTQDYPVTVSGSFSCTPLTAVFIYGDSFGVNDTCLLTFGTTGLLDEPVEELSLSGYPNPTQGAFQLNSSAAIIGETYSIYDTAGRTWMTGFIDAEVMVLSLEDLPQGIYLLRAGNATSQPLKIIKL